MITNFFAPERWGDHFLFTKRIVGVDITSDAIHVTKTVAYGAERIIERIVSQAIDGEGQNNYSDTVAQALKKAFLKIESYDEVIFSLPSKGIIFKKLVLPFVDRDKIKQVIAFEIEPLLPFSVNQVVIDFIIMSTNQEEQSSTIFVAVVQKTVIAEYIDLFNNAGVTLDVLSIDMFSLYGFLLESNKIQKESYVVLDVDSDSTTVFVSNNEEIKLIRTLAYGIDSICKQIAQKTDTPEQEISDLLLSSSIEAVEASPFAVQIKEACDFFCKKIVITLDALELDSKISGVIMSRLYDMALFSKLLSDNLPFMVMPWEFTETKQIKSKVKIGINEKQYISIATSIPTKLMYNFNLRQAEFVYKKTTQFVVQLVVTLLLLLLLFVPLIWHYSSQISKLQHEIESSQQEVVTLLKQELEIDEEYTTFNDIVEEAESLVNSKKETWLTFSYQARESFLKYLLELTQVIDKQALGLVVERISIDQEKIILKAKVRDYDSLKILERELRQSPLFGYVPPQDNPSFTMNITLAPSGEE